MSKPIFHGENFFLPVDKIPKGETTKHKAFIAGHSETGHHHTVKSNTEFEVTQFEKYLYVQVFEPARVEHQKSFDVHETLTLEPGKYKVPKKTEYDPFAKVIRQVWD